MVANKFGRGAAKAFGIDTEYRTRHEPTDAVRTAATSVQSIDPYEEREASLKDWFKENAPTKAGALHYLQSLFPFWSWIFHYNLTWLFGDIIAGESILIAYYNTD